MYSPLEEIYQLYKHSNSVSIDSRTIRENDLFFAIKGDNFDGNQFAEKAISQGAIAAIVDDKHLKNKDEKYIFVDDVLRTLQDLANHHRNTFQIPILAITGSNGKTTTKELIASILSKAHQVHYTQGNFNNHIGVPLTLLSMPLSTEIAVIEMGANHMKEIERLCQIANPTHGLITNIGKAHLEGFKSLEGVKKAKGELFEYLREHKGFVFVNEKDTIIKSLSSDLQSIPFIEVEAVSPQAYAYEYELIQASPKIKCQYFNEKMLYKITSSLFGEYNFQNIMAAITIGRYFKVPNEDVKIAIREYIPNNNRSQIISLHNNKIYLDAYNANPSSMFAALSNFTKISNKKKIVILGDMLELGKYAKEEHQKIYDFATSQPFESIILVGKEFGKIDSLLHFENVNRLKDWWKKQNFDDYDILLKGSRGIQLEKMLEID